MKRSQIITSTIIILLLLVLPVSLSSKVRGTVKGGLSYAVRPLYAGSNALRSVGLTLKNIRTLPAENNSLSNEVTQLLVENSRLKEVDYENSLLKSELKFEQTDPGRRIVAGRIIARSALSLQNIVTIDRGADAQIKVGQPVTLQGALVGKVVAVGPKTADVELVTSSSAITQAQLQNSRATGIVRGGIGGLVLDNIAQDTHVDPGENIITSGLGGSLPAGLLIGTVIDVVSQKNDIFQSVRIKSAINVERIDIVFVEVTGQ